MSEQIKDVVAPTVEPVEKESMADVVRQTTEPIMSMKKLAAAGVQFGHQMRKWNPKMAKYIYTSDRGIYIVDLKKTVTKMEEAYSRLREIVLNKGTVLFVGTNKKIQSIIKEEALRSGSFYINNRWLGGTLTNFSTMLKRIRYLKTLEQQEEYQQWLLANGLDITDPKLSLGYLKIGQVDFTNSFGTDDYRTIWHTIGEHLDIYCIEVDGISCTYDYCWSDDNHEHQQKQTLKKAENVLD
jgi:hypothetical protein